MAVIGISYPFAAKYNISDGSVSYTEGKTLGHLTDYNLDEEQQEPVAFWSDGMIMDYDHGCFQQGTLTLNLTDMTAAITGWLFGLPTNTFTVSAGNTVTEYLWNDEAIPLRIGIGIIETHMINGSLQYKAIILSKCKPHIPTSQAETKTDQIDWQTKELEMWVGRSDATNRCWKREAWFDSKDAAQFYLEQQLGFEGSDLVGYGRVGYMKVH